MDDSRSTTTSAWSSWRWYAFASCAAAAYYWALERIRQGAAAAARVEAHLVVGADHTYSKREDAVASLLSDWIASLA